VYILLVARTSAHGMKARIHCRCVRRTYNTQIQNQVKVHSHKVADNRAGLTRGYIQRLRVCGCICSHMPCIAHVEFNPSRGSDTWPHRTEASKGCLRLRPSVCGCGCICVCGSAWVHFCVRTGTICLWRWLCSRVGHAPVRVTCRRTDLLTYAFTV